MTIEDPSIPLTNIPQRKSVPNNSVADHENKQPLKSYSVSNVFQNISAFSKHLFNSNELNNKQINDNIDTFLKMQLKKIHRSKDEQDLMELETCTKDMETSFSHIKFTQFVKKNLKELYYTITLRKYQIQYEKIFSNLNEMLVVFADDFMSRNLRNELHEMLHNANDQTSLIDIFFFGKYPLDARYLAGKFRKKSYSLEGKKKLLLEINSYLEKLSSKIKELMDTSECLKQHLIFPQKQRLAISRINAITSIIKRPIPMMQNLKIVIHLSLNRVEEKTNKTFVDTHKKEQTLENLPKIENLRDLLGYQL